MEITITTVDLLSVIQAAQELGKARWTIYRWVADGKIGAVRLGNTIYIPRDEVERLNTQERK